MLCDIEAPAIGLLEVENPSQRKTLTYNLPAIKDGIE